MGITTTKIIKLHVKVIKPFPGIPKLAIAFRAFPALEIRSSNPKISSSYVALTPMQT